MICVERHALGRPFRVVCVCALGLAASRCDQPPARRLGYALSVPADWRSAPQLQTPAPGKVVEAWTIPGGGSAVVFTQIPHPVTAEQLLTLTVNQVRSQPGWTLDEHRIRAIGGLDLMWLALTGPGFGDRMAPTPTGESPDPERTPGLIATRRLWLAAVRENDVLHVQMHYPAERDADFRAAGETILQTCRLRED